MKTIILGILGGIGGEESIIILAIFALPIIALISAISSDFKNTTDKVTWVLVIILVPLLGPILYFFIGMKNRVGVKEEKIFELRDPGSKVDP